MGRGWRARGSCGSREGREVRLVAEYRKNYGSATEEQVMIDLNSFSVEGYREHESQMREEGYRFFDHPDDSDKVIAFVF